jgi:hypothetical protein
MKSSRILIQTAKSPRKYHVFKGLVWLRGQATPDPGEIALKTRTAPLPERHRWYRKNRWLRGLATPDSCDWLRGRFPGSLPNGPAGDLPLKRMRSADASPDRKTSARPKVRQPPPPHGARSCAEPLRAHRRSGGTRDACVRGPQNLFPAPRH